MSLSENELDAYAAVLTALGRWHLEPPGEDVLPHLASVLAEWPLGDVRTVGGLERVRRAVEHESSRAIRRDHDALYGRTARAALPPYESVHRGNEGLVFDEETLQVREAYRALGLRAPRLNREPDDHIGLELDFLAVALLRALDAREAGSAHQAEWYLAVADRFLREHVMAWGTDFLERLEDLAETDFMAGLAALTAGALTQLEAALG